MSTIHLYLGLLHKQEARVNEMNDSMEAGRIAMETFTLTFKHLVAFKTT